MTEQQYPGQMQVVCGGCKHLWTERFPLPMVLTDF
ncbi:hypothetical protein LCGC14_3077680, partial [marine sediment metagenome]